MAAKNKKSKGKIDLLEMPEPERVNMIEKLRQTLRQNIAETKMWNYLLQCETVTINSQVVFSG
jgi:tryptophanase